MVGLAGWAATWWRLLQAGHECVPVLTTALYERFSSRGEAEFQDRLPSALALQFGGHVKEPIHLAPPRCLKIELAHDTLHQCA